MAEGIIFGDHLLSKDDFIPLFEQFYEEKGQDFIQDLRLLKEKIDKMIEQKYTPSASNTNVQKLRTHRTAEYDAKLVYEEWERIQKDYFGNSAVTLIAITSFDGEQMTWSKNIQESELMTPGGINVTAAQFESIFKAASAAAAAEEIQNFLRLHYQQMCTQLTSHTLKTAEAAALHEIIPKKSSLYVNRFEHFTGRTYGDIIFSAQGNAEGKQLDAYMNHIGQYNRELFSLMNAGVANNSTLEKVKSFDTHGQFKQIFQTPSIVQPWLLASLNSASWLTGGDVVVVDDTGKVIYNIQIKSTMGGKNFELALNRLSSLIARIIKKTEATRFKPKQLATILYNSLKTSSANEIAKTDKFIESKAYDVVIKNLKLSNSK